MYRVGRVGEKVLMEEQADRAELPESDGLRSVLHCPETTTLPQTRRLGCFVQPKGAPGACICLISVHSDLRGFFRTSSAGPDSLRGIMKASRPGLGATGDTVEQFISALPQHCTVFYLPEKLPPLPSSGARSAAEFSLAPLNVQNALQSFAML